MNKELFYTQRNFAALPSQYTEFETSKVVILPIPYDSTTTWRSGSRDGPLAIIDASEHLELYDPPFIHSFIYSFLLSHANL